MTPPKQANVDYSLGQIDTKLAIISQTLSEDRLSDAQFRTWVREKIEVLEKRAHVDDGRSQTWKVVLAMLQVGLGLIGGIAGVLLERLWHKP